MKFSTTTVPRYDDDIDIYMSWIGDHTIGDVSCRGTRVWFHPDSCLIYDLRHQDLTEAKKNHEVARSSFRELDVWQVYGDDANIRSESIDATISKFGGKDWSFQEKSYEELSSEFFETCYEEMKEFIPESKTARYFYESPHGHIALYKEADVVRELQEALKFGEENDVTFHWV